VSVGRARQRLGDTPNTAMRIADYLHPGARILRFHPVGFLGAYGRRK